MGSLYIDDLLHSMWNTGWADMVGCRDSPRIDFDLHILHDGCRTSAHINNLHIFDYLAHFDHCFAGCYHYSKRLRSSSRLLGSFLGSLNLSGSRPLHEFLLHKLHTKMLCHFSCYMGSLFLCVLHVLGKCRRSISSEQTKHPIDLCLADSYL